MSFRGRRVLGADGTWRDGKAAPEHLRDDLRALPSDLVTKDSGDPDRAHELDEAHNVAAYAHDREMAEIKDAAPVVRDIAWLNEKMRRAPTDARVPLTQRWVDIERFHAIRGTLDTYAKRAARGDPVDFEQIYHIWFEKNDARMPSIRGGVAPEDRQRPDYLRGLHLEVDPIHPPAYVVDVMSEVGIFLEDIIEKARDLANKRASNSHRLVTAVLGFDRYRYDD